MSVIWPRAVVSLIVVLLVALAWGDANEYLRYSRAALERGEMWRLLSGHWVHLNGAHCALNVAALLTIMWVLGRCLVLWVWLAAAVFLCFFISACLYFFSPYVMWYVGFSGVLHGLLMLGLVAGIKDKRDTVFIVVIGLLIVKVVWEQLPGFDADQLERLIDGRVVVDAHLYGTIGGALLSGVFVLFSWSVGRNRIKPVTR